MAQGRPNRCTGSTARVRAVTARSAKSGSRFMLSSSTSTNTGSAPTWLMASAVAKKVNGVVITSSPGPMPRARRAMTRASVPELQPTAWATPR